VSVLRNPGLRGESGGVNARVGGEPVLPSVPRTTLHTGCRVKNIRKWPFGSVIARPRNGVFVQHSVHDVQLPVPDRTTLGATLILPIRDWSNVRILKDW
jgi:hypothetical protein